MIRDMARRAFAINRNELADHSSSEPASREPASREPASIGRAPSFRRSISKRLAVGALISTALLGGIPAVAQASPAAATMTISSDTFPSGASLPGGLSGTVAVTGGSSVALTAPEYLYQLSNPPGTLGTVYEFMFWDVNSTLINTASADFSGTGRRQLVHRFSLVPTRLRGVVLLLEWRAHIGNDLGLLAHGRQGASGYAHQLREPVLRLGTTEHIGVDSQRGKDRRPAVPRRPHEVLRHPVPVVVRLRRRRLDGQRK